MICLNCKHQIEDNVSHCPYCDMQLNSEKTRFLKYIGDVDSLIGYQKSYKLILLKIIFEFLNQGKALSVDSIMYSIKAFYLNRIKNGLPPDYEVDDRIAKMSENTSIYDIWAVFKANPYNVINNQGFLFLEKNNDGELIFVLPEMLLVNLTPSECSTLIDLLNKKLDLYYSRLDNSVNKNTNASSEPQEPFGSQLVIPERIPIEITNLSVRAQHCLLREGYKYVEEILELTEDTILNIKNAGQKTAQEIIAFISNCLKGDYSFIKQNTIVSVKGESIETNYKKISGENILQQSIENTSLGTKAQNALIQIGCLTVGDLLDIKYPILLNIKTVGARTINEIIEFVFFVKQHIGDCVREDKNSSYTNIKYPYCLISTECENIPVVVLSCFGLSSTLISSLQSCGIYRLGQLKKMDYSQIHTALGDKWVRLLIHPLSEFNDGIVDAVERFLDAMDKEEDLSVIVKRSQGATLQEIGDETGMTRQGVCLKIDKPLKIIKPMAACLADVLIRSSQVHFLTLQDVYDIYDNDNYDAILSYALRESEDIETVEPLGWFFIKQEISINSLLRDAIQQYVGDGILWNENIEQLVEILQNKNLLFVDLDDVWLYMLSMGYKTYGEYVSPHSVSYGVLLTIVLDKFFPQGITFSDPGDMALLREKAIELFGNLHLPEEDRAVASRVADYLILCDRGKWISPSKVAIESTTLDTIKNYIDNSSNNIIYYQALFTQFEGLLTMTSEINNYHYLHGVLKQFYGNEYSFTRDYLQKENGNLSGRIEDRIYDYIFGKGKAASRDELKAHLKITSDVMILNAIYSNANVFQWEFNYYNCLGNISISHEEEQLICEMIDDIFSKNKNYCSAKMIFEYCNKLLPEVLERNQIKNCSNLFYVISTIAADKYKFRNPHIVPINSTISTTEEIVKLFIDPNSLNLNELLAMSDRFGWGRSTVGFVFDALGKGDYYRISQNQFISKNRLSITERQIQQIMEVFDEYFESKQYIGVWEINYNKMPTLAFEWTPYLLETIVSSFIKKYRILVPAFGKNSVERGIYVHQESTICSYDELIVEVIKSTGRYSLTENELFTLLVLHGVIKNSLPTGLKESSVLQYNNGVFSIKVDN